MPSSPTSAPLRLRPDAPKMSLTATLSLICASFEQLLHPLRKMLAALVGGQRDPKVLAEMVCGSMRRKIPMLEEAFTGYFTNHHVPADQDAGPSR
jgi:hypothetical protein